ncbi:MAG: C25 family cysteine peptidase, partial [Candidatus Cloacimonas sp.]|nr:C25 family cysteine peptidase [Candidatus Cloacimonas sp.]
MKRALSLALALAFSALLIGKISLLSQRGAELVVEYTTEPWVLVPEGDFTRLSAQDMDYSSVSGAPLIPYDEFKIGIPPSGEFTFSILESQSSSVELPSRLLPVPAINMKDELSEYTYQADSGKYQPSRVQTVEALEKVNFRGYEFIPFKLNPFSYNGQTGLQVTTKLVIKIVLSGNLNYRASVLSDPASDIIMGQILNNEQAKYWQNQTRETINYAPFGNSDYWMRIETNRDGIYRLDPAQLSGFPLEDIDPRQFRMFSTSGKVLYNSVVQEGSEFREIPIQVAGEADGSFDAEDYILFYGSSRDAYEQNTAVQSDPLFYNPYSQNQVFWLSFAQNLPAPPLRMYEPLAETYYQTSKNSTPAIKHVESESQRREDTGFTWFGARWFGNSTSDYQLQTELSDVAGSTGQNLSFRIRKEEVSSDSLHVINVEVNGTWLISNTNTGSLNFTWYGTDYYTFNMQVTGLINGINTIRIKVIRSITDNLFFDWYSLSYQQNLTKGATQKVFKHTDSTGYYAYQFNLSGDLSNTQLFRTNGLYDVQQVPLQGQLFVSSGTQTTAYYLLKPSEAYSPAVVQMVNPTDLTADASQVDNIIVTPNEFAAKAEVLAQMYLDVYGVRSRVVLQSDIFDQFNGGHPDPVAIRQAMRYYYFNLPIPRVSSLTMLGIGTIDWRN